MSVLIDIYMLLMLSSAENGINTVKSQLHVTSGMWLQWWL